MKLSCADLRSNDLAEVIPKVNRLGLSADDIENMKHFEKCLLLNKNPVTVARYFQYKVEVLFREIILLSTGLLGKVKYYTICIEFQLRGCPHIHSFLWILNPVQLNEDTVEYYIEFIDSILSANLPFRKRGSIVIEAS